ncbi:MAG: hypothetical protein KA791_10255 [Flavobacteriales bacterium]|nr:hypothetical protein [Flavobacteriales bacterium]
MMRVLLPLLAGLVLLLSACKKEPGEGGKSEVRGYVYEQAFNDGTCQPIGTAFPVIDARVYIMYGDHDFYDDDVRTGPDGLFAFSWLREGDYRIYAVSECRANCETGCMGEQKAVFASASVDGKDEVTNLGILTVKNY